jgi:hypothetical protein
MWLWHVVYLLIFANRQRSAFMLTVDPESFTDGGIVREEDFLRQVDEHNWEQYRDEQVLIRGCESAVIPPWAYMIITARLTSVARSVRFGNEHDNLVVHRRKK